MAGMWGSLIFLILRHGFANQDNAFEFLALFVVNIVNPVVILICIDQGL
jgi:hypothetical protein